ncbi:nucleotidyl transferase AbiEii/AbiGii toxin family protein [Flavobacterium gawalongense]|uniref:Nucleotidyl transferase AbiEii/AbiGii toxin family protein n=1 Tax=Flavobacterium gawalongense TaxID=2594432 RepID=A0A553BC72_9FLAO|nr:nucleotidyl transferase AbiEii/AbiGii toxin family protein [Flavobacterium gawalongense]TRX05828.1 nucleotidyl transferase AbiEii/AbiGii toxin family protein [Flavobacterium gawalongense]TRX06757.1 nucleotidyl transferase AbiEii/AbiGii toxin family protein [Flavobacterium gawalongense]TRX22492.1 nucleotidyl transferase AbiEii/AbiGii toxin family protein [Flavobacterium gawalongense]
MAQINFHDIPENDKKEIYKQVSNISGMADFAVEKDWWVVQTLSIIFEMEVGQHLVFKGGTSLSKAWKLIERFSEDIDLAIDRKFLGFEGELSKNQRTELRKAASRYVAGTFFDELQKKFQEKGLLGVTFQLVETKDSDQDPRIIEVYYPNVIETPGYIQPRILIEIGCRSLREPFSVQTFASLVDEEYTDSGFAQAPINVPTVNPERTFLEKIFLLHEEFHKPVEKIRVDRLSRHLYDVFQLAKTDFAITALKDAALYETIVNHRHKFTRVGGVNYNKHQPQTINPIPIPEVMEAWKADYKTMQEQMIYVDSPSFEEIIEELTNLKNRINAFEWKMESQFPVPNN